MQLAKAKWFLQAMATVGVVFGGVSAAQAAWTYTDVDINNTVDAATGTYNNWDTGTDGASPWRFRSLTGPAAPAFPAGAGTAYTGRNQGTEVDPNLITTITGLDANTEYNIRVYGVFPNNATARHFAAFSTDGGTTLDFVDNRDGSPQGGAPTITLPHPINWVDNTDNGVGAALPARGTGDTRFYAELTQTVTSNSSGNASILLVLPTSNPGHPTLAGGAQDRFNIDGYAVNVVPEPTSIGLLGLGVMGLLRRRSR